MKRLIELQDDSFYTCLRELAYETCDPSLELDVPDDTDLISRIENAISEAFSGAIKETIDEIKHHAEAANRIVHIARIIKRKFESYLVHLPNLLFHVLRALLMTMCTRSPSICRVNRRSEYIMRLLRSLLWGQIHLRWISPYKQFLQTTRTLPIKRWSMLFYHEPSSTLCSRSVMLFCARGMKIC